jgi:signal transduction histidine kinase
MPDRKVKFLLVDDLEANLVALEALLRRPGLELLQASSGPAALELLLRHDIALAILDVQMPEMDGFQLAELMRGTERTRTIPIIFVTADATNRQRHFRGYELGAVDFLFKPIDPHILKSKADVFFDLAKQRNDLTTLTEQLRASEEKLRQHAELLEQTVEQRTAQLTETVQELEAFSYSIAHDMRAPLRSMIGYSEAVCEDCSALDQETRHYLERIKASAHRLDRLTLDILSYSRVARAALPLEPVDIGRIVADIADSYPQISAVREQIQVKGVLPPVVGNAAGLTQVLSNLIGNAIKFVAPGEAPSVRIWAEPLTDAADYPPREEGWVRFWIEDRGIGIDPHAIPNLFQMFHRVDIEKRYEGTGIGLAIARKAIERMGGRIGVESQPGQGSRFWFVLPASRAGEAGRAAGDS